ncbi:MAG: DNA topoisomerase IV subunit A [Spirochaetales bacterium]|nr:DNA topoisomerase IV subunit A [Spirochaetales bacterium]
MAYVQKLFNTNFLEYASYVIKDRAIPHINDGLKPVQRRILHTLIEKDDGKFHKVANIVGHTMQYHPHGDASIYSALVVLANKDLFIDRQGNFGNIYTGDEASAARYIECRILPLAKKLLYNPEITEFEPSYDGRNKEPVTFPAKVPLVLVLGAEGIAVGMSTKILPHNFIEVMEAVKARLLGKTCVLYPDFPTAGIVDVSGYDEGMGKVLVRAKLDTSDEKRIVIRELPFGATTESLINSIEAAGRSNKLKIAGISDFTTDTVEIEIKLARGVHTQDTIDALYAFTDCEMSISVNCLVIRDNKPVLMRIPEIIDYHAEQLVAVLKAELRIEEKKLKDRLHARTLEQIFIEERIYKDIENKKSQEAVTQAVFDGLKPFAPQIKREVTEEDVDRLLKIPIRRISLYDINKAKREMEEIEARLKEIRGHLKAIVEYAVGFLDEVIREQSASYPRRTQITSFDKVDIREAAQRNLDMRYDGATGYLGYEVRSGKALFRVSTYDRILVIRKTGAYSVIDVPEKLFVDKGMLYCGLADKEDLANIVFTLLYREDATGYVYIKRCQIEKFIMGKGYTLCPEGCSPLRLTTDENTAFLVKYKPKPRVQITEEYVVAADYLVKGVGAKGVRVSTREFASVSTATREEALLMQAGADKGKKAGSAVEKTKNASAKSKKNR